MIRLRNMIIVLSAPEVPENFKHWVMEWMQHNFDSSGSDERQIGDRRHLRNCCKSPGYRYKIY